jgi:hypothetical protein
MQPRVFIPHIVRKFDHESGKLVQVHDFEEAMQFGQLMTVLDDGEDPNFITRLMPKIKRVLSDFTHQDYLLAVGDPCIIAACAGSILSKQPMLTMLKWQRSLRTYVKVEIKL